MLQHSLGTAQNFHQVPDLGVDFRFIAHGFGNLRPQRFAVLTAQPVHRHFQGAFGNSKPGGGALTGAPRGVSREKRRQRLKTTRRVLLLQALERPFENRQRPAAFVYGFGGNTV